MERQKSLGLAGAALLQKDSHTILAITATLAAGMAIVVLAAVPFRVAAFWALSELLFAAYQLKRYAVCLLAVHASRRGSSLEQQRKGSRP